MDTITSRRALLGAVALAPMLIAAPAVAATSGNPVFTRMLDASDAARLRFDNLPDNLERDDPDAFEREEDALNDAANAAWKAVPTTWSEFTRLFSHVTHDGKDGLDDEWAASLLDHARRLTKQEG